MGSKEKLVIILDSDLFERVFRCAVCRLSISGVVGFLILLFKKKKGVHLIQVFTVKSESGIQTCEIRCFCRSYFSLRAAAL